MESTCCTCGGPLVPLGSLGQLDWHRCRDCGMDQSTAASEADEVSRDDLEAAGAFWDRLAGKDEA